jgi:hypothetical protein
MDIAKAAVINLTSPLWTALLAAVFEKGSWTRWDSTGALCCLAGVVLMLQPPPLFPGKEVRTCDLWPGHQTSTEDFITILPCDVVHSPVV